jgi:hypothetical protein
MEAEVYRAKPVEREWCAYLGLKVCKYIFVLVRFSYCAPSPDSCAKRKSGKNHRTINTLGQEGELMQEELMPDEESDPMWVEDKESDSMWVE